MQILGDDDAFIFVLKSDIKNQKYEIFEQVVYYFEEDFLISFGYEHVFSIPRNMNEECYSVGDGNIMCGGNDVMADDSYRYFCTNVEIFGL